MSDDNAPIMKDSTPRKRPHHGSESHFQPRQRREMYTAVACNECKKRKIKCSGDVVCRRCEMYDIPCNYTRCSAGNESQQIRSTRFNKIENNISSLQEQVGYLLANMRQIQSQTPGSVSIQNLDQSMNATQKSGTATYNSPESLPKTPKRPQYLGTTSTEFGFHVANSTLNSMGLQADLPEEAPMDESTLSTRHNTPEPQPQSTPSDPFYSIPLAEKLRLLQVYKEEVGEVYPFIDVDELSRRAHLVCDDRVEDTTNRDPSNNDNEQDPNVDNKDLRLMKMMIATALVLEGLGQSAFGQQLVESVELAIGRSARDVETDFKELQILTVSSVFYFHSDEEVLAWRTIGFASRMALEMGLHLKGSLCQNFPNADSRAWPIKLFWCIFVLDRRWSFGTGMPFALQDTDIDPQLPTPGASVPYLECLVAYGRICSKVWQAIASHGNKAKGADNETISYLDFQIQQWVKSIPSNLQITNPHNEFSSGARSPVIQRLRVLLYVRGNQMRTLIHRQYVLSATKAMKNLEGTHLVTDIAKDTIRVLVDLNKTTEIYRMQQNAFNYFLVSALAAIFLAVCHAPAKFSHTCRSEFYEALDLVKNFSTRSAVSRRLWKSVRKLKYIAPRLGLAAVDNSICAVDGMNFQNTVPRDNRNTPAHTVNSTSSKLIPTPPNPTTTLPLNEKTPTSSNTTATIWTSEQVDDMISVPSISIPDMSQMSSDLTNFFEAFGQTTAAVAAPAPTPRPESGFDIQETSGRYEQWLEPFLLENGDEVSRLFEGLM